MDLNVILESVKNSPIIWFLGVVVAAFGTGFAAGRYWQPNPSKPEKTNQPAASSPELVANLDKGVRNFFAGHSWMRADPSNVMGEAKDIAGRLQNEVNVFDSVKAEIEDMKKHDANWTNANRLTDALNLVRALGLSERTKEKNQAFIEMTLPPIKPKDIPKRDR